MALFSDLPNELLYDILRLALPEDLENFAQISKRVQVVAMPLLQTHRALIRKYHTFENKLYGRAAVTSLLQDILTTPRIAHYVREAKVDCAGGLYGGEKYTEQKIEWLCAIAAESEYLVPYLSACVGNVQDDIKEHCQDAALALLLPLLPNLETLWLEETWQSQGFWVRLVVGNAPRAAKPFLTKLARVCLRFDYRGRGNWCHLPGAYLKDLRHCAALPSIKELSVRVSSVGIGNWGENLPPLVSGATKLELVDSGHDFDSRDLYPPLDRYGPKSLYSFLEDFPKLEVFSYSTRPKMSFSMFEASLIKKTLLATVKTTLRTLTILGRTGYPEFMGSVRDFEVLTELHADWSSLVEHNCNLQPMLPVSLRKLQLDDKTTQYKQVYKRLMKNILSGNLSGVLQLEHIALKTPKCQQLDKTYLYLRQICREKGLLLTFPSSM